MASRFETAVPRSQTPEKDVARAVFLRVLDLPQKEFWVRAAKAARRDFEVLDCEWRALNREGVRRVIEQTRVETKRLVEIVARFPESERDNAWSWELGLLIDSSARHHEEARFAREVVGVELSDLVQMNTAVFAGSKLKDEWLAWVGEQARAGRWHVERNDQLEAAIEAAPGEKGPVLAYAEWIARQPHGEAYGEFLRVFTEHPESWEARLMVEHDPAVKGNVLALGARLSPFVESIAIKAADVGAFLAEPHALRVSEVHVIYRPKGARLPGSCRSAPTVTRLRFSVDEWLFRQGTQPNDSTRLDLDTVDLDALSRVFPRATNVRALVRGRPPADIDSRIRSAWPNASTDAEQ